MVVGRAAGRGRRSSDLHRRPNPDFSLGTFGQRVADTPERKRRDAAVPALGVRLGAESLRGDAARADGGHRVFSDAADAQTQRDTSGASRQRHDAGVREKTYRIFVEELPPAGTAASSGVRVLTKMGIPIFVRPVKEVATATLNDLRQQDGAFRFTLTNAGTVHVVPQTIKVRGLAGSNTAFDRDLEGWYVLAGGRREFEMAFPKNACAQVTSIAVDIQFASGKLHEQLQTPNGACPR